MRPRPKPLLFSVILGSACVMAASTPAVAADPAAAPAADGQATVYIIQGVDDTTMSLSVDGKSVKSDAAAKTVVGPLRLAPGRHTVTATPSGGGAPVQAAIQAGSGSSTDVVLHRQVDVTKPPVITAYPNDLSAVTAGSGRLTVAHTAAVGPADIRVKGKVLFANVANGEELTLTVPQGSYPVDIVPAAAQGPVVFGPVNLPVKKATLTRVFAIGVAATNSMDAVVQVLPVPTRGSGTAPALVDAGDGGQAESLIASQQERGSGSGPTVGVWAILLLLAAASLSRLRRHPS